ncbi:hypothetical protein KJ991_02635 [Patescibacteria group bacterium]|nr:hypothetical protein [Patescibacteria group bacterium]MBU4057439.1 hypothetical protein [Patescibacteria group bacterium]MBU4115668.1 hypothetical protein [Patescibacteria group bacterium]
MTGLLNKISDQIINPIILLLFVLALLYFIWGVTQYVIKADSDEQREQGKQHMIWGVVGMFIMVAVYGIIEIIKNTIGV